jgi:hypothetical protein
MKKISTLVIIMLVALTTSKLYAQKGDDYKKFSLGLGLEGALPLTGLNNAYSAGGGLTLRGTIGLDNTSAVTITTGAIAFIPKSFAGVDLKAAINIPVKAGYKYMLSSNFYAIGEAGMTFAKVYASAGNGQTFSATSSSFTYAPGIGVQFGGFDTSIRYEGYSGSGFLGLRVGFNF